MRTVPESIVAGILALIAASAVCAQPATPASAPASAPEPMTAASRAAPPRNPAITASENAKEPGAQRPAERVIPQLSVPLKSKNLTVPATSTTSAPAGTVNDSAARCLAAGTASEKAACELQSKASGPVKAQR